MEPALAKWFVGAQVNASYNCVDRHLKTWRRNKAAIIFEGEPGDSRVLTYRDLYREVNRAAAALKRLGVKKGDRVAIYLGMVPELPIAMLACARIGAPHTVIFAGFSAESIADRANDCGRDLRHHRRRRLAARQQDPAQRHDGQGAWPAARASRHVLVVNRTDDAAQVPMQSGRDVWWHDALNESGAEIVEPEAPGRRAPAVHPVHVGHDRASPRACCTPPAATWSAPPATHKYVFDLKEEDVFFCTADIGWVTGHSYIVYGPLANGATCVMYEGSPDYPDKDRFWCDRREVRRHASCTPRRRPSARSCAGARSIPSRHDLTSLRVLGSVGEPINPEAWVWYREVIGLRPLPGRRHVVDDRDRPDSDHAAAGHHRAASRARRRSRSRRSRPTCWTSRATACRSARAATWSCSGRGRPWRARSGATRSATQTQYWSRFPGNYFAGDGARRDEEGYYWLLGRVDDVLNVAGHRIGTMEVESALVSHPAVAEAAVIGITHEIKGQGIAAFVTLRGGFEGGAEMVDELRNHVGEKIGAIAKPDKIFFTAELPKTRSAKIMRRLLRDIAEGKVMGDTTTLADPAVLAVDQRAVRRNRIAALAPRTLQSAAGSALRCSARRQRGDRSAARCRLSSALGALAPVSRLRRPPACGHCAPGAVFSCLAPRAGAASAG